MQRLEWILGMLLAVLLAGVAMVAVVYWLPDRIGPAVDESSQPASRLAVVAAPDAGERTAMVSLAAAQSTAGGWQSDALLLRATATWPPVGEVQMLLGGTTDWAFTFYSPSARRLAVVAVVDGRSLLVTERELDRPLASLAIDGWQVDSGAAIQKLLENGGQLFVSAEGDATLTMTLSTNEDNGRIEWLLSLFGNQSGKSLTMRLDANTGEVIDDQHAP